MAGTEVDRLVVVFDANFARMEEKLNKVIRSNQNAAAKVEKSWGKDGAGGVLQSGFNDLTQSMTSAANQIPIVGSALSSLGPMAIGAAAGLGALAIAFQQTTAAMDWGDELATAAAKIGIGTEALQELQFAADETDVPIESLRSGLERLNGSIGAMKTGLGDAKVKGAFEQLLITPEDLAGIDNAADLLPLIAERIAAVGTQAEQVQIAKKLGIEDLLPMLQDGADGLKAMTDEARALGLVVSDEMVQSLADADRQMEITTSVIKAQFIPVFVAMANEISAAAATVENLIKWFRQLIAEHPKVMEVLNQWNKALDPFAAGQKAGNWVRGKLGLKQVDFTPPVKPAATPKPKATDKPTTPDTPDTPKPKTGTRSGSSRASSAKTEAQRAAEQANKDALETIKLIEKHWADVEKAAQKAEKAAIDNNLAKPFDFRDLTTVEETQARWEEEARWAQQDLHDGVKAGIMGGLEAGFHDGLPGVLSYLQDALMRSVLDSVAEGLTNAVLQGSKGGQGGLLTSLASALFGPKYAAGTMSSKHGMALVGERGPELVNLPGGSEVMSNQKLRNVGMGSGKSATQTVVFDNRGAVIWEQAAKSMMSYADRAAASSGLGAVSIARRATPSDLARESGRRLGR
jgi:hypothetical protein